MNILRDIEPKRLPPTCVAVGVFDGVHLGHQAVLRQAVAGARERGLLAAAVTFDPHPARVLQPRRRPLLLTTMCERTALIAKLGIEVLVIIKFDRACANQAPEEFARRVLVERFNARCVVAGEDFAFGRSASGSIGTLIELGGKLGFDASAVKRITVEGAEVSSTAIRELISAGQIERATALLGHEYVITGQAAPGSGRGRDLGFPTANICVERDKLLPPNGVYAVRAHLGDAKQPAVANIGVRPTFDTGRSKLARGARCVEAHLMGARLGELYGQTLTLELAHRLRDEKRFATPEALAEQIRRDVAQAQEILLG
jgi:riboflavin kinase/FMN adenylyltransferase